MLVKVARRRISIEVGERAVEESRVTVIGPVAVSNSCAEQSLPYHPAEHAHVHKIFPDMLVLMTAPWREQVVAEEQRGYGEDRLP